MKPFRKWLNEGEKPRVFYRGEHPDRTERIRTGDSDWDSHLFVSSNRDSAAMYGPKITKFQATPDAKILYHGTKEYRSMSKGLNGRGVSLLKHSTEVAKRAKAAGYDAVHFQRQGDVGTAVFNKDKLQKIDETDLSRGHRVYRKSNPRNLGTLRQVNHRNEGSYGNVNWDNGWKESRIPIGDLDRYQEPTPSHAELHKKLRGLP